MNLIKFSVMMFSAGLISCTNSSKKVSEPEFSHKELQESTFISNRQPVSENDQELLGPPAAFPSKWESIEQLTGGWTNLERENEGYVVYNPIKGNIPRIRVTDNKVTVFWWLEGPNQFRILNTSIANNGSDYIINAESDEGVLAQFTAHIIEGEKQLVAWKFNINWSITLGGKADYAWITTKQEYERYFKYIDYKNSSTAKGEKEFLPIEIDL